ncbi:MAG: glycosyltransferase family 4 protein [Candidatus Binatia bacterium]
MPAKAALRIGIDGTCLGSRRGYGRFLREVLPCLLEDGGRHRYVVFLDRWTAERVGPLAVETTLVDTTVGQADAASGRGNRSLRDLVAMGFAVARARLDVIYFPSVYSYFPVPSRVPVAVAFHDTIAERHGAVVFPNRRTRWLWNLKVGLARRQAAVVVTVSEWSRRRLHEAFGIPLDEIHVALEAPAAVFMPSVDATERNRWLAARGVAADEPYLLYVGGFNPHKNLGALVDAFADATRLRPAHPLRLILVGDWAGDVFHADVGALRGRIERAGLADRVLFAGFVPDEELRHLYAGALAVVLPSLEEGFGLPAIEGAACGAPAIATRRSPLPELLEGGGLFVDPDRAETLREAILRLVDEPELRDRLGAIALAQVRKLSWRSAAEATRRALEQAAGR